MRPTVTVLIVLTLAACGVLAGDGIPSAPRLRVEIYAPDGHIQYRWDQQMLEADEGVQVRITLEGQPDRAAIINAGRVGGSLSGQMEASRGVTIGTPQGVLVGEHLTLNTTTGEFRLQQAQAAVDLTPDQPQSLLGYIFGEEIRSTQEVVYVLDGRITTSDRRNPEYTLEAKRIECYPRQRRFKITGAALRLHGVRLPLIPKFSFRIGKDGQKMSPLIPLPGYSSRDKLCLPYQFNFSSPEARLQNNVTVRLTQKRGIRLHSANTYTSANWAALGIVSQTEDAYSDRGAHLVLDRRPELRYTRFSSGANQDTGWAGSLTLANIVEELQTNSPDPAPTVREQSTSLSLRYDWHNDERRDKLGKWCSVAARQTFYSSGDNYQDIALTAGAGGQISSSLRGSLSLTHHILGGRTPFLHDEVGILTELQPACELWLSPNWSLRANASYDMAESDLRDYDLELRRRAHALTWGLKYRSFGNSLGIAIYVNGLTGDTAPYRQTHPLNELYEQTQQELAAPAHGQ